MNFCCIFAFYIVPDVKTAQVIEILACGIHIFHIVNTLGLISSQTLPGMWLLVQIGIKVNPC